MRIALLVLLLTSTAVADVRVEGHVGGGLEGGLITDALRPDGVAEAGARVYATLPGKRWGFGASFERIGRLTPARNTHDEVKLDLSAVWTRTDAWISVGVGVRSMRYENADIDERMRGFDLIHLAGALSFASWETTARTRVSIDGYLAWTFGCYSDTVRGDVVGDMVAPTKTVECNRTITTTYTLGIATSMSWR